MLESCPSIVRHARRPLVFAITVTVFGPTHARLPLPVLLVRLALESHRSPLLAGLTFTAPDTSSELQADSSICLGFKRSSRSLLRSNGFIKRIASSE